MLSVDRWFTPGNLPDSTAFDQREKKKIPTQWFNSPTSSRTRRTRTRRKIQTTLTVRDRLELLSPPHALHPSNLQYPHLPNHLPPNPPPSLPKTTSPIVGLPQHQDRLISDFPGLRVTWILTRLIFHPTSYAVDYPLWLLPRRISAVLWTSIPQKFNSQMV